jgi:enoyl-CoA hydratase/carnithine racemase
LPLHYSKDGPLATFTIENGSVNPLTPQIHKELNLAMRDFLTDTSIHCGILTGAGERAFCAGDDIKADRPGRSRSDQFADLLWPHHDDAEQPDGIAWTRDTLGLDRFKPIIGAVSGWCLGQGLIYLLHLTDIRLASPDARFGFPEIAYQMAGAGGTTRLGLQIPHTTAMWMLLTGEPMTAAEAAECHLVNRVVPRDELMDEARAVAQKIIRHPPPSVRVEMEAYYRCLDMTRSEALAYTRILYRLQRFGADDDSPAPGAGAPFLYHRDKK